MLLYYGNKDESSGMKTQREITKQPSKAKIKVDPNLDERFQGKVLFPEKIASVKEIISKYGLPPIGYPKK